MCVVLTLSLYIHTPFAIPFLFTSLPLPFLILFPSSFLFIFYLLPLSPLTYPSIPPSSSPSPPFLPHSLLFYYLHQEGECHQGVKPARVVFCGSTNKLFTTGFSRQSERQYALWDPVSAWDWSPHRYSACGFVNVPLLPAATSILCSLIPSPTCLSPSPSRTSTQARASSSRSMTKEPRWSTWLER